MNRRLVATLLQAGGVVALTVGAFTVGAWLGWMVAGAGLTVFGVALERD